LACHAGVSDFVKRSGIQGGIVVHLDCGSGEETLRMRLNKNVLVQGLSTNPKDVDRARALIGNKGLYGDITVNPFDGKKLPYAGNLVNMVVCEGPTTVPQSEIMRVLTPLGTAYINGKTIKKPWPKELDEWGHYLHAPDNNAVVKDKQVGMPRALQWVQGKKWARSHEEFSTISVAVSSQGKVFYIVDKSPLAYISFNAEWMLVARDAFNGRLLWERAIPLWNDRMRQFRSGPAHLPRRLVAVGDKVYVTLGLNAPLTALDANTGRTIKEYKGTDWAEEVLVDGNTLYVLVGTSEVFRFGVGLHERDEPGKREERYMAALNATTGEVIWKKNAKDREYILPMGMALSEGNLYFHSVQGLGCLDAKSGKQKWMVKRPTLAARYGFSSSTLVATPEVVLLADYTIPAKTSKTKVVAETDVQWAVGGWSAQPDDSELYVARNAKCEVTAYSTSDGGELWKAPCDQGYNAPVDVFVVDGLVWLGHFNKRAAEKNGYDLKTGAVVKTINVKGDNVGMVHDRCYRNKASEDFLFTCRDGIEVHDFEKGWIRNNSWTRGPCQFGIMPANGLMYAPTDPCACHLKMRLPGFKAYSCELLDNVGKDLDMTGRLTKGPAFGQLKALTQQALPSGSWPMYRSDIERSASAGQNVALGNKLAWTARLGGSLTQPVAAAGRVYVASTDRCTVHCLRESDGSPIWKYVASGAIDSSPTLYKGLVVFGTGDGRVHCLDAKTGRLAWHFLAAPLERLVSVHGRLASSWPVHGSVIVKNGEICFTAGSSSYLGGGIYYYRMDPLSGKVLGQGLVTHIDPATDKQVGREGGFDSEGVSSDILSSDGEVVFLKHLQIDDQGNHGPASKPHLFSPTSLLHEEWYVRSYWTYATGVLGAGYGGWVKTGLANPSGRVMAFTPDKMFGYGRVKVGGGKTGHRANQYHLYASSRAPKQPQPAAPAKGEPNQKGKGKKRQPKARTPEKTYDWTETSPFTVRAMVATPDQLILAGVPNLGKRPEPIDPMKSPEMHKRASEENPRLQFENPEEALEAFRGQRGAYVRIVSTEDGSMLKEFKLDGIPVGDGMSVVNGRLFVSLKDGVVACYGGDSI